MSADPGSVIMAWFCAVPGFLLVSWLIIGGIIEHRRWEQEADRLNLETFGQRDNTIGLKPLNYERWEPKYPQERIE